MEESTGKMFLVSVLGPIVSFILSSSVSLPRLPSLSFAKSITGSPLPSTIPFSSVHSSLLPTSTLFLCSFLRLQEKTGRSYNLNTLQRYCFQLYKLFFCHTAIISGVWTAGLWAPALGHLQQAQSYPKGRLSHGSRTMGCALGQKIPLQLQLTLFTSMWFWSIPLTFNISFIKQDKDNLCFRAMQEMAQRGIWAPYGNEMQMSTQTYTSAVTWRVWGCKCEVATCHVNFAVPFIRPHETWGAVGPQPWPGWSSVWIMVISPGMIRDIFFSSLPCVIENEFLQQQCSIMGHWALLSGTGHALLGDGKPELQFNMQP